MKQFKCDLLNIQHIQKMCFKIDLSKNQLMCIVGKNGCGKTTLIRAIKTLYAADTFAKTASPYIFQPESRINFNIDNIDNDEYYSFQYDNKLKVIDTKALIDSKIKQNIYAELPIPHGERFNYEKLGKIDSELRANISLENYKENDELIKFLKEIYQSDRFNKLKEITINKEKYYFILKDDDFYIREDYLSSGEHFIISLYKIIQKKHKLIVIDEIDISLDTSAQVRLIKELKSFCKTYEINIVFTTHSLALMKTVEEIHYMDFNNGEVTLTEKSYNYIKSLLFEFKGWDKYILTEDKMLEKYLKYLINKFPKKPHYKYKIIYIGGYANTVDLMERNEKEEFFADKNNVISVLDGDVVCSKRYNTKEVFRIPFKSIEKSLFESWENKDPDLFKYWENKDPELLPFDFAATRNKPRRLYNIIVQEKKHMTDEEVFVFLDDKRKKEVNDFSKKICTFLNKKIK